MSSLSLLASLKAFDATVREGTMSDAARSLGLKQPTLSAHIARLGGNMVSSCSSGEGVVWSSPNSGFRSVNARVERSEPKKMLYRFCLQ